MAFGIFKKKNTADIIYMNGHIYTQDPAFPWASAVACREGRVLAVGDFDGMDEIISEDTVVYDLEEKYVFPGFIDVHGTPVLKVFEDKYLSIDPVWDLDTVLEAVSDYAEACENEVIFAYGYNENILSDYDDPEDAHRLLDEAVHDRPVVLLGISGVHCWINTLASDMVTEAAEDEGLEYISADYILNFLSPFDFEEVEKAVLQNEEDLADKGITSVMNLCAPDYLSMLYQDCLVAMIGESISIKQRFAGSLYVNRPLNPELILHKLSTGKTNCTELGGLITFDHLKLEVNQDEEQAYFSQEALDTICLAAAEKGYHIHLDALDQESFDKAADSFGYVRSKGCKHNTLIVACDQSAEEDAPYITTWPTDYLNESVFAHCHSVSDAIDQLTTKAAEILGRSDEFGSIEQGKIADFTVFEENPFDSNLENFSKMHAALTVIDSQIAYDVDEECMEEMCDLLLSMRL